MLFKTLAVGFLEGQFSTAHLSVSLVLYRVLSALAGRKGGVLTYVLVVTLAGFNRKLVLLENLKGTIFEKLLLFSDLRFPFG